MFAVTPSSGCTFRCDSVKTWSEPTLEPWDSSCYKTNQNLVRMLSQHVCIIVTSTSFSASFLAGACSDSRSAMIPWCSRHEAGRSDILTVQMQWHLSQDLFIFCACVIYIFIYIWLYEDVCNVCNVMKWNVMYVM